MQLHSVVANAHERAYCKMMSNIEMRDDKEATIDALSTKLYDELSDDDYLEIEEIIRMALGWENINPDSVQTALRSICYVEAEYRFNEKNKLLFY
ncbi:hypothetical protein [Gilliamella sp. ESL0250]|uniref:hypothetical protein n=1 Tax=Gilliamella sp. ESL0250 TaxID=2705036 RepID=UPI0015807ACB|nr:hypothetical protein [Gilliamella sp. ESL0250]NUF48724.1 hypothetical protein [Gilliamella sp. ESL0250]